MPCRCIDVSPLDVVWMQSNFCLPNMHLYLLYSSGREIGYQHRIFDLLDERPLNKDEIRDFCHVLLGREYFINAPDVHADWNGFCKVIVEALKLSSDHWNPLTNKMQPWIDMGQLKRAFGGGLRGIFKKKKR